MSNTNETKPIKDSDNSGYDVLIIGSGFAGIGLACQMELEQQKQHQTSKSITTTATTTKKWNYILLEKESDLGGTWRDNTYPGAACDIPSALYSYSFAADDTGHGVLGESSYSEQSVILDYIRHVSDTFHVSSHIHYNQCVSELQYDSQSSSSTCWTVRTTCGSEYRAKFVVSAVGQLHYPAIPTTIPGEFQGASFHSTQIPKDFDFDNKTVAVIGSGCTAAQIIPALQPICQHVHVYQRSPSWVFFKILVTRRMGTTTARKLMARVSAVRWFYRQFIFQLGEGLLFSAIQGNWFAQQIVQTICWINLYLHISDPNLRAQLTPKYPAGAKRVVFSNDYYTALNQPNVSLTTSGIAKLNATGIVDNNGIHVPVDVILYATGFVSSPFLHQVQVQGIEPNQYLWKSNDNNNNKNNRCTAYFGMATHGFPNLFFVYGPNTNISHNSILIQFEEQSKWIIRVLTYMQHHSFHSIHVKKSVEQAFVQEMDDRSAKLAFHAYQFENQTRFCDEQGRNQTTWVGSIPEYRDRMRSMNLEESFEFA